MATLTTGSEIPGYRRHSPLRKRSRTSEEAVVYFTNTDPGTSHSDGEFATSRKNDPIEIIPANCQPPLKMKPESRIRFSKDFAIEVNLKVKEIGQIHPEHMSKFLNNYQEYGRR